MNKDELRQEEREEPLHEWVRDNENDLIMDFIKEFPPEEQPLDDDTPDFLDNNADEFNSFARRIYLEEVT